MGCRILSSPEQIDEKRWEQFVRAHPDGNIFQTPIMFAANMKTPNHSPFVFAICDDEQLTGILSGVILREYPGPIGELSTRAIIFGGPLVVDNNTHIAMQLLQACDDVVKKTAIYSQFRNMWGFDWGRSVFDRLQYRYEDHLNILIDLTMSEADLWNRVNGKRRNEIRRAVREKNEFSARTDDETLELGYGIIKHVYRHARLPLPGISLFRNVLFRSTESEGLKIFSAFNQGSMIGVMFALVYNNRIYDWYAGAYLEKLDKYPNDLIPWEVMKWGKAHGFEIFDFGGAGRPGVPYGVRDYKIKFGGELVNYGRFEKIHQPGKMKLARAGFKIWRLLKK